MFATLQNDSKLRLNVDELKEHPFVTGDDIDGMKFQETINQVHIMDRHVIIGGREGSVFVVDFRTLKTVEIDDMQENHTRIIAMACHGYDFAVVGEEGKITICSLGSEGSTTVAVRVKTLNCHEGNKVYGLLLNQKYFVIIPHAH